MEISVYVINDEPILSQIISPLPLSLSLIGGLTKIIGVIPLNLVEEVIKRNLSQRFYSENIKALRLGFENLIKY